MDLFAKHMENIPTEFQTEINSPRIYHKGDTFYISSGLVDSIKDSRLLPECEIEKAFPLEDGIVVVFMESVTKFISSGDLSFFKVQLIYPDGKRMAGSVSGQFLSLLSQERRYGRKLNGLDKVRAEEMCGIVPKEKEEEKLTFRKGDSETVISQLRREAMKIVFKF